MSTENPEIEAGYYALVPDYAYVNIDDLPTSGDLKDRLLTVLGRSRDGFALQAHDSIEGLFWAWKLIPNGWIMVMLGDKANRSDTPGEAYEKCSADLKSAGMCQAPLAVMWIGATEEITVH